jgi:hypothetical protein
VKNDTGGSVTKGQAVYISGANGDNVLVSLADADTETTSSKTLGLLYQDLAVNGLGYIVTNGLLTGIDTSGATAAGDSVWLSGTAGGRVYGAPPAKPAHSVYLGVVTRKHATNGEILVKVQNGYELNELHDVFTGSAASGDLLKFNGSAWVNTAQSTLAIAQSQVTNLVSDLGAKANLAGGNTFTGAQVINTGAVGTIGLQINTPASPTNHMQVWSLNGSYRSVVDKNGFLSVGGSTALGNITSYAFGASQIPLVLRGAVSQTANLQEWQNSSGVATAFIDSFGGINTNAYGIFNAGSASTLPLRVRGAASQTASLTEWQNSSGTVLANVSAGGSLISQSGRLVAGGAAGAGRLDIQTASTTQIGSTIRGSASQTADLTQWQDSTQAVLAKVDSAGNITGASFIKTGGTSSQFLKADGSVDSSTYLTSSSAIAPSQVTGTAVITTDSRLSNARTPTAHASSHGTGGSDVLTLAQSQIVGLETALAARPEPGSTGIPYRMAANTITAFTGNASVTFPASRFTQAPIVTVTMASSTSVTSATIASVSTTGFTIYAWAGGSAGAVSRSGYYQAIQMTSGAAGG